MINGPTPNRKHMLHFSSCLALRTAHFIASLLWSTRHCLNWLLGTAFAFHSCIYPSPPQSFILCLPLCFLCYVTTTQAAFCSYRDLDTCPSPGMLLKHKRRCSKTELKTFITSFLFVYSEPRHLITSPASSPLMMYPSIVKICHLSQEPFFPTPLPLRTQDFPFLSLSFFLFFLEAVWSHCGALADLLCFLCFVNCVHPCT